MTIQAFFSSMNAMTTSPVISGWSALAQQSLAGELRPLVDEVSVQLGQVLQDHNCRLVSGLFQAPPNEQSLMAGYGALESFVTLYSGNREYEPLFEGLAASIRGELNNFSASGALQSPESEMPDESMVDRYEAVLKRFLPKRYRRIIQEVDTVNGSRAIRATIRAIERNIAQAPLEDVKWMLMFLKDFIPEGEPSSMGFKCLIERPPKGLDREFIQLRLQIVRRLLQERDQVTYASRSTYRFLYENTASRGFERDYHPKGYSVYIPMTQEVAPEYNEFAQPIMISVLEDTERELEERLAALA